MLLAYRSTPLEVGYSPSELLMCRKLRTDLPEIREQRKPKIPDTTSVAVRDQKAKERQKENFDSHQGAKELQELVPGDSV